MYVQFKKFLMTHITIRLEDDLRQSAKIAAASVGVSLSFAIKNFLQNFSKSPYITIGEPQKIKPSASIQNKMDTLSAMIDEKELSRK